jgi:hypothetical protein
MNSPPRSAPAAPCSKAHDTLPGCIDCGVSVDCVRWGPRIELDDMSAPCGTPSTVLQKALPAVTLCQGLVRCQVVSVANRVRTLGVPAPCFKESPASCIKR